jgi:hypothetical protein
MASVELTIFCHGTEKMLPRSAKVRRHSRAGTITLDLTTHPVDACAPASLALEHRALLPSGVPVRAISHGVASSPGEHAPATNLQY